MSTDRRFPFPIPFGWFQVAYPEDLEPGDVTPLHYLGRELVLWRDEGGEFHLQDAYCPHLGAHIGHGGTVAGGLALPVPRLEVRRHRRLHERSLQPRTNKKARLPPTR